MKGITKLRHQLAVYICIELGHPLQDAAEVLGVTRERIRQIIERECGKEIAAQLYARSQQIEQERLRPVK